MMRRLLTPRWIAFTALMFAATIVSIWLAWWQLERYEDAGGSFQNLGYTLQWPVFGAFALYLWWRLLRDASKPKPKPKSAETDTDTDTDTDTESEAVEEAKVERVVVPEQAPAAEQTEDDPELAEYNRYLAELAERSKR